jgi:hypothetical protein
MRCGEVVTSKRVEDHFLEDDLRWLGVVSVADAIGEAETTEAVEEIVNGLQWLVDWAEAGNLGGWERSRCRSPPKPRSY